MSLLSSNLSPKTLAPAYLFRLVVTVGTGISTGYLPVHSQLWPNLRVHVTTPRGPTNQLPAFGRSPVNF